MSAKLLLASLVPALAQQAGNVKQEVHPPLSIELCTKAGGCVSEMRSVTIDANWRWLHTVTGYTNCYDNGWDKTLCPDDATCTKNCALDGENDYEKVYGVKSSGAELDLAFMAGTNVGSRNYLMEDETTYKLFKLKNREFSFDVDVSKLPCGINGALYFVAMDADGGMSEHPSNKAGAKYGTGYCDAQCPQDIKFITGEANVDGKAGSCCTEMDLWEANSVSTAYTAHACSVTTPTRCEDNVTCGSGEHRFDGVCDKNGCDFQTYRLGDKGFYGNGSSFAVDTSKVVTVVTQWVTEDGSDTGALKEIRRHYLQDGKVIETPSLPVGSSGSFDSVSDDYCEAEVALFKDGTNFLQKGGLAAMDAAAEKGMVLVLSLWDDTAAQMLWLDSDYPTDTDPSTPGVARGTCSTSSGKPSDLEKQHKDAAVKYSNIRFGEIGSTHGPTPAPTPAPAPTPSPAPSPSPSPSPTPSDCPGGSLAACFGMCPSDPAGFEACMELCEARCEQAEVLV